MKHFYVPTVFIALLSVLPLVSVAGGKNQLNNVFIENRGQVKDEKGASADNVLFYKTGPMELFITTTGFSAVVKSHDKAGTTYNKIDFVLDKAAISKDQVVFVKTGTGAVNIYAGRNMLKGLATCNQVLIKNIYPGIDWLWTIDKTGAVNHDFMVNLDADASVIHYHIEGAGIDKNGGNVLRYMHPNFRVKEGPVIFRMRDKDIPAKLNVEGNSVSFELNDSLKKKGGFTIDPPLQLEWSLGQDSFTHTAFRSIVADDSSNTFTVGYSSDGTVPFLPQVNGSYITQNPANRDVVIMKTDPNQDLVWATFFGGSNNDEGNAIVSTPSGIYITGYSESWDFPVEPGVTGNFNNFVSLTGRDAFISKFNSVGKLLWSSGYGGAGGADEGMDIKYYNGLIYMVGYTASRDFPVMQQPGAYFLSSDSITKTHGFIAEFDTADYLIWATCFGGAGYTYTSSAYVDSSGVYTTGYCDSIVDTARIALQNLGPAYYQATSQNIESFVTRFSGFGALQWSTYFGGSGNDVAACILRNNCGLYICGKTDGSGLPVKNPGGTSYYQGFYGGGDYDGFIAEFDPDSLNETYCTYYGTQGDEALTRLASDTFCNVIFTGFTNTNLPSVNSGPCYFYNDTLKGGYDGLMLGLDNNRNVFWSTLFGSYGNDFAYGLQFSNTYVVDMVGEGFYNMGQDTIGGTYYSDSCTTALCPQVTSNGESNRFFNCIAGPGNGGLCGPLEYQQLIPLQVACPQECNGWAEIDTANMGGCHPYTFLWSNGGQQIIDTGLCTSYWSRVTDAIGQQRTLYSKFNVLHVPQSPPITSNCNNIPDWDTIIKPQGGEPPYTITFRGPANDSCPTYAFFSITDSIGCEVSYDVIWYRANRNLHPLLSIDGHCHIIANFNPDSASCVDLNYSSGWKYVIYSGTDTFIIPFNGQYGNETLFTPTKSGFYSGYLDLGDCQAPVQGVFFYPNPVNFIIQKTPDCHYNDGVITAVIYPDSAAVAYYGADSLTITVFDSTTGLSVQIEAVTINSYNPDTVSFPNLAGDIYLVSVYNNTCDSTVQSVNLKLLSFTFDTPYVFCGDTVKLSARVIHGVGPFSFMWSTGQADSGFISIDSPGIYSLTVTDGSGCTTSGSDTVKGSNALLIDSIIAQNYECPYTSFFNYIAATAYVSGGTPPYDYVWSSGEGANTSVGQNTAYDLLPFYNNTLTVTDLNTCSATAVFYDSIPPPMTLTDSSWMPVCYDSMGIMNVYVTGGFPGPPGQEYSVTWFGNSGSTYYGYATLQTGGYYEATMSLPPDYYEYYVNDNYGCYAYGFDSVQQPFVITYTLDTINCLCFGDNTGGAELINIQSTISYTITWSDYTYGPVDSGIYSGYYSAYLTDSNGCQYEADFYVSQPQPLYMVADTGLGITCSGGAINVIITGVGGITPYSGDSGTYLLGPGSYYYYITDSNNCFADGSFTLSNPPFFSDSVWATQPDCNDNYVAGINVSTAGGVPPYFMYTPDSIYTTSFYTNGTLSYVPQGLDSVVVSDSHGCALESAVVINPSTPAQGYTVPGNPLCAGDNSGSVTINIISGVSPFSYNGNMFYNSFTVTNLSAGDYSFYVYDSLGCGQYFYDTLSDPQVLTANYSITSPITCYGGQAIVLITASGGTPGYTGTGAQNYSAGVYQVTVQDFNGCQTTVNLDIIQPDSLADQLVVLQPSCSNPQGSAQVYTTGGTLDYTLFVNGSFYSSYNSTITLSSLSAGPYNLEVQDGGGCTDYLSATINNYVSPQGNIIVANPTCYQTSTGSVEIDMTQGTGPFAGPNGQFNSSTTITNLYAGSYTYTITDSLGCPVVFEAQLTDPPQLTGSYDIVQPVQCNGEDATVVIYSSGGTPPVNGTGTFYDAAGQYDVTLTDNNGCSVDVAFDITQPQQALTVSANVVQQPTCSQSTGLVTIYASGGEGPYAIAGVGNFSGSVSLNLAAGSYSYQVQDNLGCTEAVSFIVTQITENISATAVVEVQPECSSGNGIVLINASGGTDPYKLQTGNGNITFYDTTSLTLPAGSYNFQVQDSAGCSTSISFQISPGNQLSGAISTTNPLCYNDTGNIVIDMQSGTQPFTINSNKYYNNSIQFGALQAGQYTYTVADSLGCSITLYGNLTQPAALVVNNNLLQSGVTCTGLNNAVVDVNAMGGTPSYTFTLESSLGPPLSQFNNNVFTSVSAGNYTVVVSDANGCTDSLPLVIPVFSASTDSVVADSASCYGSNTGAIKIYPSPPSRNPYTFSLNGGTAQVFNVFYNLGAGIYQVVVTDTNGCKDTIDVSLGQPDSIDGRVWLNDSLLPRDTTILTSRGYASFTKLNSNPWKVVFTPPLPYTINTDSMVQVQTSQDVTYTVTVYMDSTDTDCFIRYTGLIEVIDIPEIPNTFTPNGDGFNDVWKIDPVKYPNPEVMIFDRWGEVVFTSNNYTNDWGGIDQRNGKQLPDGAYFYVLKIPSLNNQVIKGNINIVDSKQ